MLTRRAVLKYGVVAAGATLLSSKATRSYADVRLPNLQLTPFTTELTFPPDLISVGNLNPSWDLTKHTDFRGNFLKDMHQHDAFEDTVLHLPPLSPLLYEVDQQEAFHLFHPALPPTSLWGYSGLLPGPTFRVYQVTQATHRAVQAQPYSYASTQQ